MSDDLKKAWTLIGGGVEVTSHTREDIMIGKFDVIVVEHEDGTLVFTEDEATNLIGALSVQLMQNRRRRYWSEMQLREERG